MAFCVHDPFGSIDGGCFWWSATGRTPKFFIPPSPTLKNYSSGVQNTVYVCGESLIAIWGGGGRGVLLLVFEKGYGRREFFSSLVV